MSLVWGALAKLAWGREDADLVTHSASLLGTPMPPPSNPRTHADLGQTHAVVLQLQQSWGLQALLRVWGVPHIVRDVGVPSFAGKTRFPALLDGSYLVPERDVVPFLRERYPERAPRSGEQMLVTAAALVDTVRRGLDYTRFYDPLNRMRATEPQLKRRLGWPVGPMALWLHWGDARARVDAYNAEPRVSAVRDAEEALVMLQGMLIGDGGEFFGGVAGPNSIDALVFGAVADALADARFHRVVQQYGGLVTHFERMRARFFPGDAGSGPGARPTGGIGAPTLRAARVSVQPLPSLRSPRAESPAPAPAPGPGPSSSSSSSSSSAEPQRTPEQEAKLQRKRRRKRIFVGAGVASYALFGLLRMVAEIMALGERMELEGIEFDEPEEP